MQKHAYLIMAHGSWKILEKLLRLLDSERHDIFLHIDKKVTDAPDVSRWVSRSGLFLLEPRDVVWADYSQTQCEFRLLEAAMRKGDYSYYHLLSGVDMPVKPVGDIYRFFEESGKNFLGFHQYYGAVSKKSERVKYYHPLVQLHCFRRHKSLKGLDRVGEYAQRLLRVDRLKKTGWKVRDGYNWFSIRGDFGACVLENEPKLEKMFRKTIASDEMAFHTVCINTDYYDTIYDDTNVQKGCLRAIDWQRGLPYVWGSAPGKVDSDFEELMSSEYMFARKFDENHMEIVDRIYDALKNKD